MSCFLPADKSSPGSGPSNRTERLSSLFGDPRYAVRARYSEAASRERYKAQAALSAGAPALKTSQADAEVPCDALGRLYLIGQSRGQATDVAPKSALPKPQIARS